MQISSGRVMMDDGVGVPKTALNEWARRKLAELGERRVEVAAPIAAAKPTPKPKRTKGGKKPGGKKSSQRKLRTPEQMAKDRAVKIGVPAIQIERGGFIEHEVVDLSGELGDGRGIVKVLLNQGGTAIARWLSDDAKKPAEVRQFGVPAARAIAHCQSLWVRCEGRPGAADLSRDRVDCWAPLGWSQQEAMDQIGKIEAWFRVRRMMIFFAVFEQVVRFDQPAGVAGSALANNSRSATDRAQTTVAMVANVIASEWGL